MELQPVMIFGASGLGKVALEIFKSQDILVYCLLDDDKDLHGSEIDEVGILGSTDDDSFIRYVGKKCDAFIALEDPSKRKELIDRLLKKRKAMPVNAVHKAAVVASNAFLGYGNLVNATAVISAGCKVPNHCIINTGAVLEHGVELGDFVQIGANATINANVKIGEGALIGSGSIIAAGIQIGEGAQVAPGSLVLKDVEEGTTVFGSPAQEI
ncbi:acetyltransferase [Algivirga pacifica]